MSLDAASKAECLAYLDCRIADFEAEMKVGRETAHLAQIAEIVNDLRAQREQLQTIPDAVFGVMDLRSANDAHDRALATSRDIAAAFRAFGVFDRMLRRVRVRFGLDPVPDDDPRREELSMKCSNVKCHHDAGGVDLGFGRLCDTCVAEFFDPKKSDPATYTQPQFWPVMQVVGAMTCESCKTPIRPGQEYRSVRSGSGFIFLCERCWGPMMQQVNQTDPDQN